MTQKTIAGSFDNTNLTDVKTSYGTFHEVVAKPAEAKQPAPENKPARTRTQNLEILRKVSAKANELFKISGDKEFLIEQRDLEKLPDAKLNEIVNDLKKKVTTW